MEKEHHEISAHDKDVLTRIFSPNLPYGDILDEEQRLENELEEEVETDAVKEAKQLEVEGVKQAEAGHTDRALELFSQAIQIAPEHASSFNNRAQALRLQGDVQNNLRTPTADNVHKHEALEDLNRAIELSHGRGSVACQAYTQRGLIKRLDGDEDGAKEDLRNAANLGGQFAKQLLVALNPYAALCNQMLAEVMCKLRAGDPSVEND